MSNRLTLFSSSLEQEAALDLSVRGSLESAITGVGLVDSAIGSALAIKRFIPSEIVYFGSCGRYPGSDLSIGDVVSAGEVGIGSGETLAGHVRFPTLLLERLSVSVELTKSILSAAIGSLPTVSVFCTLGVTESKNVSEQIGSFDWEVENLELFSVMRAAGEIPVSGFLVVTNDVGPTGGSEWRSNYQSGMRLLANKFGLNP